MNRHDLSQHKKAFKQLAAVPKFAPQKRKKLPKPFRSLGGDRISSTGMLDVSADHVAIMYWRDGPILTDRSFYGYLFCRLANGDISPLFEFHWHPSHKGFHCKTPCDTHSDYTNRTLPGAPELAIKTNPNLDPRNPNDLLKLVMIFCGACGIALPATDDKTQPLWQ